MRGWSPGRRAGFIAACEAHNCEPEHRSGEWPTACSGVSLKKSGVRLTASGERHADERGCSTVNSDGGLNRVGPDDRHSQFGYRVLARDVQSGAMIGGSNLRQPGIRSTPAPIGISLAAYGPVIFP